MSEFDFKPKIKIKDSSIKSQRQLKVGEELRYLISNVLLKVTFYDEYINNNNITITEVNISPDLKNAKIFIMPLGGKNQLEVVDSLNKVSGRIKKLISSNINLRQMPKLNFKIDKSFDNAQNIENILKNIKKWLDTFRLREFVINKINGWIILDKQVGITSRQAVNRISKMFNIKKVGHAGTLDPMATGILPIAVGEATKCISFLQNKKKNIYLLLNGEKVPKQMMLKVKL
jgi:ribosome-binding factor A